MTSKSLQTLVFIGAAVIALIFLKLMFDINKSMTEMTSHVGAMSQDVRKMQDSIRTMNDSIVRMEESIHAMGQAFSQGTKQFQQMNPSGMMRQMLPGSEQRTR